MIADQRAFKGRPSEKQRSREPSEKQRAIRESESLPKVFKGQSEEPTEKHLAAALIGKASENTCGKSELADLPKLCPTHRHINEKRHHENNSPISVDTERENLTEGL